MAASAFRWCPTPYERKGPRFPDGASFLYLVRPLRREGAEADQALHGGRRRRQAHHQAAPLSALNKLFNWLVAGNIG